MTDREPLKILYEVGCAADLRGPLKHYRWFASRFHQDFDICHSSVEEAVADHVGDLDRNEAVALKAQLEVILQELETTFESEDEKLRRYWFDLGAQCLPPPMSLQNLLRFAHSALQAKLR